jgi:BirA family biotin operon repressor/biotin-[acetyl-CoA-carboxylase] ligase
LLLALHRETLALEAPGGLVFATHSILNRLERSSTWIRGKRVHVDEAGGYSGTTAGLDARGFLLVEAAGGLRTVLSGGVRELQNSALE